MSAARNETSTDGLMVGRGAKRKALGLAGNGDAEDDGSKEGAPELAEISPLRNTSDATLHLQLPPNDSPPGGGDRSVCGGPTSQTAPLSMGTPPRPAARRPHRRLQQPAHARDIVPYRTAVTMAARVMKKTTGDAVCRNWNKDRTARGPCALPGEDDVRELLRRAAESGLNDIPSTFVPDPNTLCSVRLLFPFPTCHRLTFRRHGFTIEDQPLMRDEIHENAEGRLPDLRAHRRGLRPAAHDLGGRVRPGAVVPGDLSFCFLMPCVEGSPPSPHSERTASRGARPAAHDLGGRVRPGAVVPGGASDGDVPSAFSSSPV
ncbi:hypothetical protein K438DRAFT_1992327 [Mycena galopus ATCC 62051]|nr:hypothetical protein K438DRAFT_1992327 [Mycena galopus ATCC 62051]